MPSKLYVGNLAYAVTNEDLTELFAQVGSVEKAVVVTDKFSGQPATMWPLNSKTILEQELIGALQTPLEAFSVGGDGTRQGLRHIRV